VGVAKLLLERNRVPTQYGNGIMNIIMSDYSRLRTILHDVIVRDLQDTYDMYRALYGRHLFDLTGHRDHVWDIDELVRAIWKRNVVDLCMWKSNKRWAHQTLLVKMDLVKTALSDILKATNQHMLQFVREHVFDGDARVCAQFQVSCFVRSQYHLCRDVVKWMCDGVVDDAICSSHPFKTAEARIAHRLMCNRCDKSSSHKRIKSK
jgi:hypothetical protein